MPAFQFPIRSSKRTLSEPGYGFSVLLLIFRIFLSGVLLYAASKKLINVKVFALSIDAYQMIPQEWAAPLAFLFIWTEIIAGALLLFGLWSRASAVLVGSLMLAFIGAISWALLKELNLDDCGCGISFFGKSEMGWHMVFRNLLFLTMSECVVIWGWRKIRAGSLFIFAFIRPFPLYSSAY